jgi:hypothetical protein
MRGTILFCLLATCVAVAGRAEEYRVYTEHPRLLLGPQRLRLLKRERERQSMRWRQFEALIQGSAQIPEPGFALSLYSIIAGDAAAAKRAVDWALGPGNDLRQMAFVYDWCQDRMTPPQLGALRAKIQKGIAQPPAAQTIPVFRDRALAGIAIADENSHPEEGVLRPVVEQWFQGRYAPGLLDGREVISPPDAYALIEMFHAIRDNLNIDLRESAPAFFKTFPEYLVLANYPAPYQAPENEYRIPVYTSAGQPDMNLAALTRAAGLSMVAFDNNATETQFLQGWLIQDRFLMRGVYGAPYEFLWANPYQPGLSYFHLPLGFHDPHSGALFIRSSWEDDAVWFGLFRGEAQLFEDGKITVLTGKGPVSARPIQVGATNVLAGRSPMKFRIGSELLFIVGLKQHQHYLIEVDDEELREEETDSAGTLELHFPAERNAEVRIEEANGRNGA